VKVKDVRTICFAAVVLFLCACPALGTIEFKDGLTHDIDCWVGDDVFVYCPAPYMYTTVNWLDGASIDSPYVFYGYEQSRINVLGGYIWWLRSFKSSQVNICSGSIRWFDSHDSSRVDISDGLISKYFASYDSSQVDISGGSIYELDSCHFSQVNISGGSIDWFHSSNSSQVDISGGSINNSFGSSGSSQVNIFGGSVSTDLLLYDQSKIQIFGFDFAVDGQPFGYGELTSIFGGWPWNEPHRRLTGTLLSGELIDNDFLIGQNARIVLIPEPASAIMLGLGGLFFVLRRKQSDRLV
jgi:hypothetical protein